jgi:hypothetical protein
MAQGQDIFGRHELHQQIYKLRAALARVGDPHGTLNSVPAPECTHCHGFAEPVQAERLDASAFGLGLPDAEPRDIELPAIRPTMVHLGRSLRATVAGVAEAGHLQQVQWCTNKRLEGDDTLTRILNLVTCPTCAGMFNSNQLGAEMPPATECLDERMKGM